MILEEVMKFKGVVNLKFADTHAHIHFPKFKNDLDDVINRFKESGGKFLLNIGVNIEDSEIAVKYAKRYGFKAAVGIHPHDSKEVPEDFLERLQKMVADVTVAAIGECGLDYYRDLSPRDVQREVFQSQIDLAAALNIPLVVHIRDAYEDAYEILSSSELPNPPGVIHAFSADEEWALKFVKLGFFIGIGGPVTYPKNHKLRDAVRIVGIKNILTETDCPYLPPQRFRGKRNEPSYIKYVLEELSGIFGKDPKEIGEATLKNALEVFRR